MYDNVIDHVPAHQLDAGDIILHDGATVEILTVLDDGDRIYLTLENDGEADYAPDTVISIFGY